MEHDKVEIENVDGERRVKCPLCTDHKIEPSYLKIETICEVEDSGFGMEVVCEDDNCKYNPIFRVTLADLYEERLI